MGKDFYEDDSKSNSDDEQYKEDISDCASDLSDEQLKQFLRGVLPPEEYIYGPPENLPCGHCCKNCTGSTTK